MGSLRKIIALALLIASTIAVGPSAHADHEGCYVIGEVQGLDVLRSCSYVAKTATQNVYVGTPYDWRIWVLRWDDRGEPLDVTLASGTGPVVGPPPTVSPIVGETVWVTMVAGCSKPTPYCGTLGFLGAGLEQGH
jgi:hypothetical protein